MTRRPALLVELLVVAVGRDLGAELLAEPGLRLVAPAFQCRTRRRSRRSVFACWLKAGTSVWRGPVGEADERDADAVVGAGMRPAARAGRPMRPTPVPAIEVVRRKSRRSWASAPRQGTTLIERSDSLPWSCSSRRPLSASRSLLFSRTCCAPTSAANSGEPRWYSTTLMPFSQCSTRLSGWTTSVRAATPPPSARSRGRPHRPPDEVVERAERAVARPPSLGVRVLLVVEQLELETDRRASPGIDLLGDEVLDAAVRARAELEVELELEGLNCSSVTMSPPCLASAPPDSSTPARRSRSSSRTRERACARRASPSWSGRPDQPPPCARSASLTRFGSCRG